MQARHPAFCLAWPHLTSASVLTTDTASCWFTRGEKADQILLNLSMPLCKLWSLQGLPRQILVRQCALLAHAHFLERPQRAQRRLLCLGKTPDARDVESLVESIPQRLQRLAVLEVPEPDGPIIPATG